MAREIPFTSLPKWAQNVGQAMPAAMESGAIAAAQHLEGTVREVIYEVFPGGTGDLARSFKMEVVEAEGGGEVTVRVVSHAVHAGILNRGGRILPRTVKALAIPGRGVRLPIGKWPRDFPRRGRDALFFVPRKSGNRIGMLLQKRGRGIKYMFGLYTHSDIRARHYLETALERAQPGMSEILGDETLGTIIGTTT